MVYGLTGVQRTAVPRSGINSVCCNKQCTPACQVRDKKKAKYNVQYLAQLTVGRQTSSLQCTNPVQLDLTGFLGNTPHLIKNDHAIGIQCI